MLSLPPWAELGSNMLDNHLRSSPLLPLLCRVVRRCSKDCTVKGIPIKRGSFVVCPIYRVHYREDLWPKPDTFNPDR